MKKIAMLFLVLLLAGSFAFARGGGQAGSTGGASGGATKVDVFWQSFSDAYLATIRTAMEDQARSLSGLNITHYDCRENQSTQIDMIRTAITQGTNVLVVNIVTTGSEDAAMNIVNMARDARLPIIFFNREVSDAVINSYNDAAFVGTDADEAGYMEGQAIANLLLKPENWNGTRSKFDLNGDNRINYIMLRGEHGNAEAFGRTLYSVREANRLLAGKLTLTPSPANETSNQYDNDGISNYFLYGNWSDTEAFRLMRTALTAHSLTSGAIELVIANNDMQAIGAIEAMREQGFNTGEAGAPFIPVFGVDALPVATEAIRAGRMHGTVLQDGPRMGRTILALAQNIANGQALMANTSSYNVDSHVAKIRVPYSIVE